jgi:hypothetical protein
MADNPSGLVIKENLPVAFLEHSRVEASLVPSCFTSQTPLSKRPRAAPVSELRIAQAGKDDRRASRFPAM